MSDARKKWEDKQKLENEMLQKHLIHKMIRIYQHKNFHFFIRQNGKARFRITKGIRLQGESIVHYVKFVYWSLLLFYLNKNHTLQSAHDFTMKTMRACLKSTMVNNIVSGIKTHRTLDAMQVLGLEDEKLNVKPKKTNNVMQLQYFPSDFIKKETGINESQFDEKKGYGDVIKKIALDYKKQIDYILPQELENLNLKTLIENERMVRLFLFPYDEMKVAKWVYWSLMDSIYKESFFIERGGYYYPNLDSAHICHLRVMNNLEKIFSDDFMSKIFYGGSYFGKNDTVATMQNIGIMDARKYPGFFGFRFCMFAKPFQVSSLILPSKKELDAMRTGSISEIGRRYWHP